MAELEQGLEELKVVKQAFKDNISANNVSTSNVEFRNMPELLKQMEKKLPNQTKSVEPTKYPQIVRADDGYKLEAVGVREIPSQYIIPTGTKEITENNEYDVTAFSKVKVAVEGSGSGTGGNPKFSQLIDGTIQTIEEADLVEPNKIKDYTFYYCKDLTSAVIPSNIASIGASAFEGCSNLQTLVLADGITEIKANAFYGISASVINLPSTLSVLESMVFANNEALHAITIPSNILEIKDNAFAGCTNLTEVTMQALTPPSVADTSFPASVTAIYVAYGAYDNYVASWAAYADKIVRLPAIPSTITITVNNYLGELVSGANVTISGNGQTFTGTTNESGVFVQGDLQPATYTIEVADLDGFKKPDSQEVVVIEDSQNVATFTYLEKPKFNVVFGLNAPDVISDVSRQIADENMTSAEVESTYGWKIGDTIAIPLTTGENIDVRIIGINHDPEMNERGITLQMVNCLNTQYPMNTTNTNAGGYAASLMRTKTLPELKALLPQEWQDVIKLVNKKAVNGVGSNYNEILTTNEDLFLLSTIEVLGAKANAQKGDEEGSVYEYWNGKSSSDRIKTSNGGSARWWLRSCNAGWTAHFCNISENGSPDYSGSSVSRGVAFAFCV